jgi:DNA-binding NarL/FixJ family response regulator
MAVRTVIVDDNLEFLGTARCLLQSEGVDVVGVASTGIDALRSVEAHRPDVVLLDIDLGDENGFGVAERLSAATGPRTRVVLISSYAEQDFGDLIEASPAIGFVSKSRLSAHALVELLHHHEPGF